MATHDEVLNALQAVTDPEIGLSIVELGLVYGVEFEDEGRSVRVDMTLTSPMCPFGPQIVQAANVAVSQLSGVEAVSIHLVWVPRWDPREHASEDAKAFLGLW